MRLTPFRWGLSGPLTSAFFHWKSATSGILPLPPNLPIFISSWQGRILSSDFWFCGELVGFLPRAFRGVFIFVLILKQHENCIMTNSNSWWCYFSVVEIIYRSINECFFIDGQGNGHSTCVCSVDYSFHKTKINPLKLIVTNAHTNFFQDLYHQLRSRVNMKQFVQAYMKRNLFLSIMYNIMDNLKYSVTFTLNVHRFGLMRKQNIEKLLSWLWMTCGVGLIADITVFFRIVCSFEMAFEFVTLATQSFRKYLDGICRTQFCYICAFDVGRV